MTTGAVVLAGGKSRRMGQDKALLSLNGQTFLERLLEELSGFEELLISVDHAERYSAYGDRVCPDLFPEIGPLGGLYSALSACASSALLAVSCDMPFFQKELGEYLLSYESPEWDALVVEDRSGQVHPLCGIYHKRILPVMLEEIQAGRFRMMGLLNRLRVKRVKLQYSAFSDDCVQNINRPEDYGRLLARAGRTPAVAAVSGVKNSGKTTLLERLIPLLKNRGYRVAAVKHDGHDFSADVPGTDSERLRRAGAVGTAVFSATQCLIADGTPGRTPEHFIHYFQDVDLILIEGLKHSSYPKIEVIREEISSSPVTAPDTWLAVMTDTSFCAESAPTIGIDDIAAAADILSRYIQEHQRQEGAED